MLPGAEFYLDRMFGEIPGNKGGGGGNAGGSGCYGLPRQEVNGQTNGTGLNGLYYDWVSGTMRSTATLQPTSYEIIDHFFQAKYTHSDGSVTYGEKTFSYTSLKVAYDISPANAKSSAGYDWSGITNASLGVLGGVAEIIIGGSAEAVTYGTSTPLLIDGWVRVGANGTRLIFYFAGNRKVGNAIPGNAGAIVGKGIDMGTGKSFYDYGFGQGILGSANDFVTFAATGGTASALGNYVENPSTYNAINYGVAFWGYNNSMFNNLYPLTQQKK